MSDAGRGLPLLSGPAPPPDSSVSEIACRKCTKEFNVIFARSRRCNHCGYAFCHSCSDYQALMPRTGNETGYDAMNVCAYCIEYLTITAAGRTALKSMSLGKLRNYIAVYNIKTERVVEKDDLIDAILNARGANGCLARSNESFYRKYSVPNRSPAGRGRGFFSRPGPSTSGPPPPPPRPATAPRAEFARPDLAPDDPPPAHAYSNPPYVPRNTPPRPGQQQYNPPPHPPPPQQQQYIPPPQHPPPPQYHTPPPGGYQAGGQHGYYGAPQNPYPQYQQHNPQYQQYNPQYQQYNPQYPPPPPPQFSRPQPAPPPNTNTRPQPPPRPTSASGRPTQSSSSYMRPPSPPPRPRATSSTYPRPPPQQPTPPAPAPPPTLDNLLQMTPDEVRSLSIGHLKAVLFTNHVNAGQILEKGDLVQKVLGLVEDEKAERERARRAEEMEEMERVQREEERREEVRLERERRERAEGEALGRVNASTSASDDLGAGRSQEDGRDGDGFSPFQEQGQPQPSSLPKPASAPPPPKTHVERNGLCVVCQDEEANIAIVDCGHMSMCRGCSDLIMASSRECPLCRTRIVTEARLLRIFKT